mgnify:CR=1 FL=1
MSGGGGQPLLRSEEGRGGYFSLGEASALCSRVGSSRRAARKSVLGRAHRRIGEVSRRPERCGPARRPRPPPPTPRELEEVGGQRRLALAGGRRGQFFLRRGKGAPPPRMAYTGAVPPITSGFAKWPPFPAKLDHRGPMHETLAGLRALCTNKLNDKLYPHLPPLPLPPFPPKEREGLAPPLLEGLERPGGR